MDNNIFKIIDKFYLQTKNEDVSRYHDKINSNQCANGGQTFKVCNQVAEPSWQWGKKSN